MNNFSGDSIRFQRQMTKHLEKKTGTVQIKLELWVDTETNTSRSTNSRLHSKLIFVKKNK